MNNLPKAIRPDGDLRLVIFDCDGVLIDSEKPANELIAHEARKLGWDITDDEAHIVFAGQTLPQSGREVEKKLGIKLPEGWAMQVQHKLVEIMREKAEPMPGVYKMLEQVDALGLPFRVGSNSSHAEMEAKFATTGLDEIMEGITHSAKDMGIPKPRPDIYLHAAEEEGVAPEECIVLEDSDPGVQAAKDAGMGCVLLRDKDLPGPDWPGLIRISHLSEFPEVLRKILESQHDHMSKYA
ncbi:HAD family hydrolase [Entomobacter blattae]|uniref:Phosphoglycolate phosphatase n=1 Tax=Entomobacter blattae TaxID=2762277 RepID=A0A7H1NPV2_9PROT|nr:HAD family phosphatase [Entomobacter blattae]QNT77812.1 Phosphoglycolate phosphatase [Entomobacter blattae]